MWTPVNIHLHIMRMLLDESRWLTALPARRFTDACSTNLDESPLVWLRNKITMSNLVEANLAKTTGIVGIAVGICGLGNVICGFIWLGHNGYGGHGLWSGFGVGYFCYYKVPRYHIYTLPLSYWTTEGSQENSANRRWRNGQVQPAIAISRLAPKTSLFLNNFKLILSLTKVSFMSIAPYFIHIGNFDFFIHVLLISNKRNIYYLTLIREGWQ